MADLTRKTANLFDKDNTIVYSAYINTSDAWVNDSGSYSIKIPCLGSTTYTLSVGTSLPIFRLYESSDSDVEPTSYATGGTPISRIIRGENLSQYSFTTDANSVYIIFQGSASALNDWINSLMLNAGSEPLPYEPYGWVHSLRKQCSATETITTGQTIYANGQPISTYSIKGNTVQDGTPTPSNPVSVNGVGNKTANSLNNSNFLQGGWDAAAGTTPEANQRSNRCRYSYFFSILSPTVYYDFKDLNVNIVMVDSNGVSLGGSDFRTGTGSFTVLNNTDKISLIIANSDLTQNITPEYVQSKNISLDYGYEIPISSGQTVNNYLGSIQSTRQIYKLELTGNEDWNISLGVFYLGTLTNDYLRSTGDITYISTHYQPYQQQSSAGSVPDGYFGFGNSTAVQRLYVHDSNYSTTDAFKAYLQTQYAAGTPVTVWYVLATEETGIVNEPLMKIGDYADSISNATPIPTTDGANSITVDTTVQPSEFTATWTGWHNAYVKEKSENLWDNRGFSANTIDNTHNHVISNNLGTTISTTEGKEVTVIQSNYPTGNVSYQNGFFMIDVDYSKYAVGDIITLSFDYIVNEVHALSSQTATTLYAGKNNNIVSPILSSGDWKISGRLTVVITIIENMQPYLEVRLCGNSITVKNIMLNTGSTALPYEPYWK